MVLRLVMKMLTDSKLEAKLKDMYYGNTYRVKLKNSIGHILWNKMAKDLNKWIKKQNDTQN